MIGRLSAPIWFFLIGYANSRELDWRLWVGGLILMCASYLYYETIFPLSILFTFLLFRFILNPLMKRVGNNFVVIMVLFFTCAIFALPSMKLFEYGTGGLIFTCLGYFVRHKNHLSFKKEYLALIAIYGGCLYAIIQSLWFDFSPELTQLSVFGIAGTAAFLTFFHSNEYPKASKNIGVFKYPLFIMGRKTLEIYVLHILLFQYLGHIIFQTVPQ